MTPSQQAKAEGLKSLSQVIERTGTGRQTLQNWHRDKPDLFKVVLAGCRAIKEQYKAKCKELSLIVNYRLHY